MRVPVLRLALLLLLLHMGLQHTRHQIVLPPRRGLRRTLCSFSESPPARASRSARAWAAFGRSLRLGAVVMALTLLLALPAALAFRKRFAGQSALFYVAVASLIVPSIVVSLGIGLEFRILDDAMKALAEATGWSFLRGHETAAGLLTSALGAHLTWTLPFGLLILFAVFNRFNPAYEEAARDLGATPARTLRHVVLPIIAPSLVGVALFGFTLSWDEVARTSQAIGGRNTLPLELQGLTTTVTTPEIYALGTVTTGLSLAVIGVALGGVAILRRRRAAATR